MMTPEEYETLLAVHNGARLTHVDFGNIYHLDGIQLSPVLVGSLRKQGFIEGMSV